MQFHVRGADRSTGNPAECEVSADTPEEAERQANDRGILVEHITPLPPPKYTVVPINTTFESGNPEQGVVNDLHAKLNHMAKQGWTFESVQTIPVWGLAARAFGMRVMGEDARIDVTVAVFRKG